MKFSTIFCFAAAMLVSQSVIAGTTLTPASIDPAEESYIGDGTDINIIFDDDMFQNWDATDAVTIYNVDNPNECYWPMVGVGWPNAKAITISFSTEGMGQENSLYCVNVPADIARNAADEGNAALSLYYYYQAGAVSTKPVMDWGTTAGEVTSIYNPIYVGFNCTVSYNTTKTITLTEGDNQYTPLVDILDWGTSAVTLKFAALPDPIVKAGTYTLVIPEGAFVNVSTMETNDEIVITFIVDGSEDTGGNQGGDTPGGDLPEGEPTIEPLAYYPVNTQPFVIPDDGPVFEDVRISLAVPVTVDATKEITLVNMNDRSQPIACTAAYDALMAEYVGPRVIVTFAQGIKTSGSYRLIIPAGAFVDAEQNYNPLIEVDYTIEAPTVVEGNIDELEIVSVTPAEGTAMSGFNAGDSFTVVVNNPEIVAGEVYWSLFNLTDTSVDDGFINFFNPDFCTRGEGGEFIFTNGAIDFPFYEGDTYQFRLTFLDANYNSKMLTVNYVGTSQNTQRISSVEITGITPTPGLDTFLSAEDNSIEIAFSDAVSFVAADSYVTEGGQMASTGSVTAQPTDATNKVWKVTASADYVANNFGGFAFILGFQDAEGCYVLPSQAMMNANTAISTQFNPAVGYISLIELRYNCIDGGITVDIDPAAGEVESLCDFTLTNPDTFTQGALNWANISVYPIVLVNADGAEVAHGINYASELGNVGEATEALNTKITFSLNNTITTPGNYTLIIPWQAISLGTEFTSLGYKGQKVEYTVKDSSGISSVEALPEQFDIFNLQGMCIKRNANAADLNSLRQGIYIVNGKKYIVR